MQRGVLAAGAIAAALAAILGLGERVVDLFNDGSGSAKVAKITRVQLRDRNVTREDYCERHLNGSEQLRCLDGPGLGDRGNLFFVSVEVAGYDGGCCRLEWTLSQDGTTLPKFSDIVAVTNIPVPDKRDWPIWVPNPGRQGDFRVTFDLYDDEGHQSDVPSEPFSVGG